VSKITGVGRRRFLKGAAAGAAAVVANATVETTQAAPVLRPSVAPPTQAAALAEVGLTALAPAAAQQASATAGAGATVPASDIMVDVLKKLDFDYIAVNPGSAFDGLHESLINYGQNKKPEMLTCLHEEQAAAMAHGYAKAAGKPMMIAVHGTVGLLHASFGIFQAWCDRVPMLVIVGQNRNPTSNINRPHSAQDMGSLVVASSSNFTKSRMMAPMSCALCGALMMPVGLRCSPMMRNTGTRSAHAWKSAIDACSRPTVPWTMTTMGLPVALA